MKKQKSPPGRNEKRVKELIAHYESQIEDEEFADIGAAREAADFTLMGDYQLPRTAGFALKKDEPGFLDFVNRTLLKLEASGEAAKIYDAWFAPVPRTFHIQPD